MIFDSTQKVVFCSYKRSVPMTEDEARTIAKDTHLFGYQPDIVPYAGKWHLTIRGDGSDDKTVDQRLTQLRGNPAHV